MGWFEAFRNEHGFASYSDNRTKVTVDMPLFAVAYFCILISIATLIATLGIRGRERWSSAIRACYAVAIGSIILACLVGHGWQEGEVKITSPYVYRNNMPFEGYVGINVALHGANVTLDGYYKGALGKGDVNYAESMPWADFGRESESYSYFLQRGLPEPILKVMEFLTVDAGGLRWGRNLHSSGHYAMVLLWTSFAFWLVTNVLLFSVIVYGAYMFFMTGLTMILACVAYHVGQNKEPLVIGFGNADLKMSYGWSFWLTLVSGCITITLGLILIIMDQLAHDRVSEFFHLEKLSDDEPLEYDERKTSYPNVPMDRRGSVVPPTDRRGSIFLEPGRQPVWSTENMMSNIFGMPRPLKTSHSSASLHKINPLYSENLKGNSPKHDDEDGVTIDMERVCVDGVCTSPKKPSLATLKEHRDNHANERLSTGAPNGILIHPRPSLPDQSPLITVTPCEEDIKSTQPRRKSCPAWQARSRTPSESSTGFPSTSDAGPQMTVRAETHSRESSIGSLPSTSSDPVFTDASNKNKSTDTYANVINDSGDRPEVILTIDS